MIQSIGEIIETLPLYKKNLMRKKVHFQDLADKAIESSLKWAIQDSLKEGEEAITTNYCKMVQDFDAYTNEKYAKPCLYPLVQYLKGGVLSKYPVSDRLGRDPVA